VKREKFRASGRASEKQFISFARNNSAAARGAGEGWKFGLAAALDL
jgi:hypothetical protein